MMSCSFHKLHNFVVAHFKLLSIIAIFLCKFASAAVVSDGANAANIDSTVTGLSATSAKEDGATVLPAVSEQWYVGPVHTLDYDFKIADGTTVNNGDTATVTLPTGATFRTPEKFDIKSSNTNEAVGQFVANPKATTGQITFSNAAYWAKYNTNRHGSLEFSVTGTRAFTPSYPVNVFLAKNGWGINETVRPNGTLAQVNWQVLVNPNNRQLDNVQVEDTLGNTSAQTFDPKSVTVTDNAGGQTIAASHYTITPTDSGFTFQWNGTLDKAINIMYHSDISNDNEYSLYGTELDLPNTASITASDITTAAAGTPVTTSNTKTVVLTMGKGSATGDHTDATTSVTVKKVWQDVPDGVTTPAVTAKLYADGKDTGKTVTLNEANSYQAQFNGLAKFAKDVHAISYTVNEASVPEGYKSDPDGNKPQAPDSNGVVTLTNVYQKKPQCFTYVHVIKTWKNVPFWKCTPRVHVTLYQNGVPYGFRTLSYFDCYRTTFRYLPQYDSQGNQFVYTVAEDYVPFGYKTKTPGQQTPDANNNVNLINVYNKRHHHFIPCWGW